MNLTISFSFKKFDCLCLLFSFQVPSTEIDKTPPKFFTHWDPDSKMFTVSLFNICSTASYVLRCDLAQRLTV
jgi:hypothetical protein